MSTDRRQQARALFEVARELAPGQRESFLLARCADDPELLRDVCALLASSEQPTRSQERGTELFTPTFEPATGMRLGPYRLQEHIGSGGMGRVYKAIDTRLDRPVALKLLYPQKIADPIVRERFHQEARVLSRLDHPNICTLFEIGEAPGQPFIAMAYYPGQTLRERLKRGPVPLHEALHITIQIARGLEAAHAESILHRDIKPGNIMLTPRQGVKVLDFGIAKLAETELTGTGLMIGTTAYMAPERLRNEPADTGSDLWSLAVVLYEMLTGHPPFQGDDTVALIHAITHEEPATFPESVAPVERILRRALIRDRSQRYRTGSELLGDLLQARSGLTATLDSGPTTTERRQVTILQAAVHLTTTTDQPPDPEDYLEVLPAFWKICEKIVTRYQGRASESLGETTVVYYGYPTAQEDDARRAVSSGLALIQAIDHLNTRSETRSRFRLNVRIGIDTGLVIARQFSDRPPSLVGKSPEIAAALQHLAATDTLVISQSTHELVREFFSCRALGEQPITGLGKPIRVYRVLNERPAHGQPDTAIENRALPLVGREQELALLRESWQRACDGIGRTILLCGEAGIGKSRLVRELREHVATDSNAALTVGYCSPYHRHSPLYPIIELLERRVLRFDESDDPTRRLAKLEGLLIQYGQEEAVPLLAALLSLPAEPPSMSPQRQRQRTLEVLIQLLLERASRQPLLFVLEDVHWADPSTLEMLGSLIDQAAAVPLLAVLTSRPDFQPPWEQRSRLNQLVLQPLNTAQVRTMVQRIGDTGILSEPTVAQIVSRADGIPLFVEELARTILETGDALRDTPIPTTLRESLTARLDRLGEARNVAQLASVLGREFDHALLRHMAEMGEPALDQSVNALRAADLLYQRGVGPSSRYVFKHALVQEAAYQSLLSSERKTYHRRALRILTEHFSGVAAQQPERLARHGEAAELWDQAIEYWLQAGRQALRQSDNPATISHLRNGLRLISRLPDRVTAERLELALQMTLGPAVIANQGFGAETVRSVYERAGELSRSMDDAPAKVPALWGLWVFHLVRSELDRAAGFAEELLRIGRDADDSAILIEGHWTLGNIRFWQGRLSEALDHLTTATEIHDPEAHAANTYLYGQDPGVSAWCYLGYALWYRGHPDQALSAVQRALQLARDIAHPFSIGWGLGFNTMVHQWRGDVPETLAMAETTIEFCSEQLQPFWLHATQQFKGWALVHQGAVDEGLALIEEGFAGYQAIGSIVVQPHFLALQGECLGLAGRAEEGLEKVEQGLAHAQRHGEWVAVGELKRIQGVLLHQLGRDDAESCLREAVEHARRIGARSRELQAEIVYGRLRVEQDRHAEAVQALRTVYATFREGRDSFWLTEASTLLNEWSAATPR